MFILEMWLYMSLLTQIYMVFVVKVVANTTLKAHEPMPLHEENVRAHRITSKFHYVWLLIFCIIIVKYFGMTLDVKLKWKGHVKIKKTELNLKFKEMYLLLGQNSELSVHRKLMIYKQILKLV